MTKHSVFFFTVLFYLLSLSVYAQEAVEGIVFDKDNKLRVAHVLLTNINSGVTVYNNLRGEFSLPMHIGDRIVISKDTYHKDTIEYNGDKILIIQLKKTAIHIAPVTIIAKESPERIFEQRRDEYNTAFRLANPGDYLSVGPTGVGLSIGAIYNYFSKSGRNARRLTQYFQREYEENVVDLHFSKPLVNSVTGLEGQALDNFMVRYRPSYAFVMQATTYQVISYIKSNYEFFKFVPYIKPLPDLNKFNIEP
ncbi:hypothetical protein ACL9RF_09380 [Sphingobacterium sp. Mn56C]|uniref:hypothetical protein n=1 Tax=Sphingobacterium sp. Mn56C TaxID=3395261 RepID=UPI003BC7171A